MIVAAIDGVPEVISLSIMSTKPRLPGCQVFEARKLASLSEQPQKFPWIFAAQRPAPPRMKPPSNSGTCPFL